MSEEIEESHHDSYSESETPFQYIPSKHDFLSEVWYGSLSNERFIQIGEQEFYMWGEVYVARVYQEVGSNVIWPIVWFDESLWWFADEPLIGTIEVSEVNRMLISVVPSLFEKYATEAVKNAPC